MSRAIFLMTLLLSGCGMPWTTTAQMQGLATDLRISDDNATGDIFVKALLDRERGTGDVLASLLAIEIRLAQYQGSCALDDCEPLVNLRIGDAPAIAIPLAPGATERHSFEVQDILLDCSRPERCAHDIDVQAELIDGGVVDIAVQGTLVMEGSSAAKRDASVLTLQAFSP